MASRNIPLTVGGSELLIFIIRHFTVRRVPHAIAARIKLVSIGHVIHLPPLGHLHTVTVVHITVQSTNIAIAATGLTFFHCLLHSPIIVGFRLVIISLGKVFDHINNLTGFFCIDIADTAGHLGLECIDQRAFQLTQIHILLILSHRYSPPQPHILLIASIGFAEITMSVVPVFTTVTRS